MGTGVPLGQSISMLCGSTRHGTGETKKVVPKMHRTTTIFQKCNILCFDVYNVSPVLYGKRSDPDSLLNRHRVHLVNQSHPNGGSQDFFRCHHRFEGELRSAPLNSCAPRQHAGIEHVDCSFLFAASRTRCSAPKPRQQTSGRSDGLKCWSRPGMRIASELCSTV